MKIFSHLLFIAPLSVILMPGILHAGITFELLGDLPGGLVYSTATDVSDDGSVVVGYSVATDNSEYEAFRWENGTMRGLGDLPGGSTYSLAYGVSGDGTIIIGEGYNDVGNQPVRWVDGIISPMSGIWPMAISSDGTVLVGRMWDTAYRPRRFDDSGFTWLGENNGTAYGISPDGTVAVGEFYYSSLYFQAFQHADGVFNPLGFLSGHNMSTAKDASENGSVIVGESYFSAFRWINGTMYVLPILPSGGHDAFGVANGVSGDGSIIVGGSSSVDNPAGSEAVMWTTDGGYVPISLNGFLDQNAVSRSGYTLTEATAISRDGSTIVGLAFQAVTEFEWNWQAFRLRLRDPAPAWAHFPIHDDGRSVDTGDFLGWVDVLDDPWIYSFTLDKYVYCPQDSVTREGGWLWIGM